MYDDQDGVAKSHLTDDTVKKLCMHLKLGEGLSPILKAIKVSLSCRYLDGKDKLLYPEPRDVFPCELIDSELCRPPTSYPHT